MNCLEHSRGPTSVRPMLPIGIPSPPLPGFSPVMVGFACVAYCKAAARDGLLRSHGFLYAFPFRSTSTAAESPQSIDRVTVACAVHKPQIRKNKLRSWRDSEPLIGLHF